MYDIDHPVPFVDLSLDYEKYHQGWLADIADRGKTGSFVLGESVRRFEKEVSDYLGVEHAISVANGTDALVLSLRALDIGRDDEVITSPFSFFATAEAISLVGARPVFVDVDPNTFNIDGDQISAAISKKTKAILPVHLYGHPAVMTTICDIANHHQLNVIEDAAQAFGACWKGNKVGSIGTIGCFSFYPTKILACYGDGGLLTTGDVDLSKRIRKLRNHGQIQSYVSDQVGYNSRLDEIQAALLVRKLRDIDEVIAHRKSVAMRYRQGLSEVPQVILPTGLPDASHVYSLFTIRVPSQRDYLIEQMKKFKIGVGVYYPTSIHQQPVYQHLGYGSGDFPNSERAASEALSLPIFPQMQFSQVDRVCDVIKEALSK